jgi:hypothetical protein
MSDDSGVDEPEEVTPDLDPDSGPEDDQQTLGDIIRGRPVSPAAKAHMDQVVKSLSGNLGQVKLPNFNFGKLAGLDHARESLARSSAFGQEFAARQREQEDWLERQQEQWQAVAEFKDRERQAELDWRAGLLEQQRLTVDAITSLNNAQTSDRRINVWVLRVAILTLVFTVVGVLVAVVAMALA